MSDLTPEQLMQRIYSRPTSAPPIVALRIHPRTRVELLRQDRGVMFGSDMKFCGCEIVEDVHASDVELLDQAALDELRKPPRPAVRRPDLDNPEKDQQAYELEGGRFIMLDGHLVRKYGAADLLYRSGLGPNPKDMPRLPVYQGGVMIGTVPGDFDPSQVKSDSLLYDPRRGDFTEVTNGFQAASSLCPGDIAAVVGFKPA